jgi:hypothetical protein
VLPPLAFSVPQGKHHHYLLQCLAPWAILAAVGSVRLWRSIPSWPAWLRQPLLGAAVFGLPLDAALLVLKRRLPASSWLVPLSLIVLPCLVFATCWLVRQRNGRLAVVGVMAVLTAVYGFCYHYQTRHLNGYRADLALLRHARTLPKPGQRLYLSFDTLYPLETFHLLFYSDADVVLLHNPTFLLDERIRADEVYVLGRYRDRRALAQYGAVEVAMQSKHTRNESSLGEKRTVFRVRLRADLPRVSAQVPFTAMQGLHQARGPFLR